LRNDEQSPPAFVGVGGVAQPGLGVAGIRELADQGPVRQKRPEPV
jgi:hypothetical protein